MYSDLAGKVAVITGATGGLGPSVVRKLNELGMKFALIDYTEHKLDKLFGEIEDCYTINNIDITDEEQVEKAVAQIKSFYDKIDFLINMAGGYRAGSPVHETDVKTWDFLMNLNAKSVFLMSRAVAPIMIENESGAIINIGAQNGMQGTANSSAYGASKSAVFRLTETLSEELKPHKIRVNAVYPSIIDTPANREAMPDADFDSWVAPESIADIISFLLSNAARDITGAEIPIKGV